VPDVTDGVVRLRVVQLAPVASQPPTVTWLAGTVMTTLALVGASADSCTKFTLDPGTKPVPVIVSATPPTIVFVVGEMELTTGTVGLHCQLFWVRL
jgi:hypothetical protein